MNVRSLLPLLALSAAALSPAMAVAGDPADAPRAGTRLDISAEAHVVRKPDIATITAGVVSEAPDAATAMAENARRMTGVVAALRKAGVAERDIRTAAVTLNPQYRYAEGKAPEITGYQAVNQLGIRFRDVARAGSILDALVAQGANQINGPELSIDNPEPALDEARAAAVAKARARAELYAKAAGLRVARIMHISETLEPGPRPMPVMMAMDRKTGAETRIEAGEQQLGVTLSVSFMLE